jgi:23S rRNA (uracil1939-C5)-methyltransferase
MAKTLYDEGIRPDVVILDPPRKGCTAEVIETVAKMSPDRVVYVSCDPATLARDLAVFERLGYETMKATAVDMFPRTTHVETVCLLSKR